MEKQTRNTKQRTVILNALRSVTSHPTADEIYLMTREKIPHISLGTVYRNLELLSRQGEIICLENGTAQKRFDGNTHPHQHIRCTRCGRIGDVHSPLPSLDLSRTSVEGFTLTGVEILFEGLCSACSAD